MADVRVYDTAKKKWTAQGATGDAGHVRPLPGPQTQGHNRELIGVGKPTAEVVVAADLNTATWAASESITEVTITPVAGDGANLPGVNDGVYVCFGATGDVVAATWLSPGSANSDSGRYYVPANTSRTFRFTAPITRMDAVANFNGSAVVDLDVIVEAN